MLKLRIENILDKGVENMRYKLKDICIEITDGSHFSPKGIDDGYPMFSVKDMEEFGFNYANCKYISKEDFEIMKKNGCVPQKGDVLVAKDGSYMKEIFVCEESKEEAVLSSIAIFRPNINIVQPEFLCFLLKTPYVYNYIKNNCVSGSALPRIVLKTFKDVVLDIPNLDIQSKITKICSSINHKIRLNNDINDNLQGQIESIFKDWFIDFSPFGGEKPMFMKEVLLEKICEVVTKGTTPTTLKKSFTKTGINFIKAESILDNHSFDSTKFSFIDDETNSLLKRSIINENDILFTIAGTLGRFALVSNDILPANTNQAVAIIRHDKSKVDPYYLYSFFLGNWHNAYYAQRVQQAVQANLSLTTIKSLPILMMDTDNMKKYTSIISPLIKSILSVRNENNILIELRDTLLPKLMSGEIDVSNIKLDI